MARPNLSSTEKKFPFSITVEDPFSGTFEFVEETTEAEIESTEAKSLTIRPCKEHIKKLKPVETSVLDLDGLPGSFNCGFSGADLDSESTEGLLAVPISSIATGNQFILNAVARQLFSNFKIAIDIGKNPAQILRESGIGFFTRGISSRFAYQPIGAMPAKAMIDNLQDRGHSPISATLAAGFYETVVGTYLEARSASITFGINNITAAATRASMPFFARNCLGWVAIASPYESIKDRVLTGFVAGTISGFPDSIGNKMMIYEPPVGSSLKDVASKGFKDALKDISKNPKQFLSASLVRGAGASVTAILLSKELHETLLGALGEEIPKTKIKPISAEKPKDEGRDRGDDEGRV